MGRKYTLNDPMTLEQDLYELIDLGIQQYAKGIQDHNPALLWGLREAARNIAVAIRRRDTAAVAGITKTMVTDWLESPAGKELVINAVTKYIEGRNIVNEWDSQ